MKRGYICCLWLLSACGLKLCFQACSPPVGNHHPEWQVHFDRFQTRGCITVYDAQTMQFSDFNADRCVQRFAPHHTFVLPCALLAMQNGLANDTSALLHYADQPTTLARLVRSSPSQSADLLAQLLGEQPLQRYLQRIGYGNQLFQLTSDDPFRPRRTAISADEQVYFLKKMRTGALRTPPQQLYQLMGLLRESADSSRMLYALASPADTATTGWYIGWVEDGNQAWYFALNYEFLPEAAQWPSDAGRHIARAILRDMALLR